MINTDTRQGWTGFLPFGYESPITVLLGFRTWRKYLTHLILLQPHQMNPYSELAIRKELWDWFSAAFPKAVYCLCSATLTDAAVLDMRGSAMK